MSPFIKYLRGLLILPLILLISIPLLLLRLFAIISSKLKPGLGRALSPSSCLFAIDDLYHSPSCSLILMVKMDSVIKSSSIESSCKRLLDSNKYPELKQKLSRWMFFHFWEDQKDFNLRNHLTFKSGSYSEEELQRERELLVKKPFIDGRPIWEIVLFEKQTESGFSVVCLRVHHCLAAGYALLHLINALSDAQTAFKNIAKRTYQEPTLQQRLGFYSKLIFCGVGELLESISQSHDNNEWKISPDKVLGEYEKYETNQVPLQKLKDIAKLRNVRLSAVIFAGFAGAIRNLMLSKGQKVPDHLTIICPMPMPGHPDQLTNYMTVVPVRAPVSTPEPLERLKKISISFDSLQTSILPYCYFGLFNISGLWASITGRGMSSSIGTCIMTNFPGPSVPHQIFGGFVTDFSFATGLQRKGLAFGFSSMTYNGKLVLAAKGDKSLFPLKETTKEFIDLVVEEFDLLLHA